MTNLLQPPPAGAAPAVSAVRVAATRDGKGWIIGVVGRRTWLIDNGRCVVDSALTYLVGFACAGIGAVLSGAVGKLMGQGALATMSTAFRDAFAIKTASTVMADGAGYFASNGRLFVDAWRFIPTASKYVFKNDPVGTSVGIATTLGGIYGIGTPVGFAPKSAPIGGYAPSSLSSKGSTNIDHLYR